MDWDRVIERNREALRCVLAALVAMAGLAGAAAFTSPLWGGRRSSDRRVGVMAALQPPPDASRRPPHKGEVEPAPTLPRHLHRAVLRLLRPAESAARRLIIVAARGLVVELPPARPRKPKPDPTAGHAVLRSLGIAVVMSHNVPHPEVRGESRASKDARAGRPPVLPLFDPLQYPFRARRRTVPPHAAPRILTFDGTPPHRLPPPPSPGDPIDASRLGLRLQALASALDDLPGHARRFARWKARRAQDLAPSSPSTGEVSPKATEGVRMRRFRRLSPLRPGRPPGQRSASSGPVHEVQEILRDLQWFACQALQHPDTS